MRFKDKFRYLINSNEKALNAETAENAIGIDGLKLDWVLNKAPATTVLTAEKKNFKLPRGTEVLLRMAPPRV